MFKIISHYYKLQCESERFLERIQYLQGVLEYDQNDYYSDLIARYSLMLEELAKEMISLEEAHPYLVEINSKIDEIISKEQIK